MFLKFLNQATFKEKCLSLKKTIFFSLNEIAADTRHGFFLFFIQPLQWIFSKNPQNILFSFKYYFFILFFLAISSHFVSAAPALGLQVYPPTAYLSIKPGAGMEHPIKLKNDGLYTLEITPTLVDFHGDNESGRAILEQKSDFSFLNLDGDSSKWGKSFLIKPGEEQTLNFVIAIPSDAQYVERHLSILFQAKQLSYASASNQDTLISAIVASNLILLISADEQNRGELVIEQFSVPTVVDSFMGFSFSALVKNIGINATPITGSIKISHWPDSNTASYELYPDMVLADSKRLVRAMSQEDLQTLEQMEEGKAVQIAAGNDYQATKERFINEKLRTKLFYKKGFLIGAYDLELKVGEDVVQKRVIALPFSVLIVALAVPILHWFLNLLSKAFQKSATNHTDK